MNKKINQLFVNEAVKVMDEQKLSKTNFAKSIGYTIHSLEKVLNENVVTVVQFDNLLKFCEIYGYNLYYFLNQTQNEIDEELYIRKTKKIEIIENQFSKIEILLQQMKTETQLLRQAVGVD